MAPYQVPGATVPGAKELFIGCCGNTEGNCPKDPSKTCPAIGEQLRGSPASLADRAGLPLSQIDDVFVGAFSAGGSIVKRLMENPDYRHLITAAMLADATYTSMWVDAPNRVPPAIEGYAQYAVDVVNGPGDKLFVATASPVPNGQWASGVENLAALRLEVEKRTGRTFQPLDDFYGITPAPEHAYKLGNVIFAEYPLDPLRHGHTTIAPQVWHNILQPWLAKGKGPIEFAGGLQDLPLPPGGGGAASEPVGDEGLDPMLFLLGMSAAAAGFYAAYRFARRRR